MLISDAWAQSPAGGAGGGIESFLLIGAMFAVLYFLMIRPQMKRAKEHKTMVESLAKGDEVITAGGVLGKITANVEVQIQKSAVQTVLPKGTIKTL
jgi:preprotein translocase subunit YajC